jgi:copper chaperone CopZ
MEFNIPAMSCGHCVGVITQTVKALDPAAQVNVDLASKKSWWNPRKTGKSWRRRSRRRVIPHSKAPISDGEGGVGVDRMALPSSFEAALCPTDPPSFPNTCFPSRR